MAAYSMALAMIPGGGEIGASRTSPGTINALAVDYYRSQKWKELAPDTRKKRSRIIERFRAKHGDKRVASLRREHLEMMLAAIAKPSVKRDWFKAIRGLLRYAVPTLLKVDPTQGIATIKLPKSRGHHTWTDDEIEQYRAHWPLGTQQRLVMEFALETASRKGEVVRLGPQHIRNGAYALSELMAAKTWTSRFRRSCRPRATRCQNRISPTLSPPTGGRGQSMVSATTSPNGRRLQVYRRVAACMASRKAPCVVWPRLAIPHTS
jgi:hypothetical protein